MTREELLSLHGELSTEASALMAKKNADYAGAENAKDVFRNFRRHGAYGICVRISDKLARLETFAERGTFEVESESVRDTCLDLLNYSVLLYAMVTEKKP